MEVRENMIQIQSITELKSQMVDIYSGEGW